MYINRNDQAPEHTGMYNVFGTVNKGTAHEFTGKFTAFWNGEAFTDKDGEDLIGINDSVEFWFDMSWVADPGKEPFEMLTALQKDFGYTTGDINPVALLGLFGEAGEVLAEVIFLEKTEGSLGDDNLKSVELVHRTAVCAGELVDHLKKACRMVPGKAPSVFIASEDGGEKFDIELADTLYYLNLLALNRGYKLSHYAMLSVQKVKDKNLKGQGLKP